MSPASCARWPASGPGRCPDDLHPGRPAPGAAGRRAGRPVDGDARTRPGRTDGGGRRPPAAALERPSTRRPARSSWPARSTWSARSGPSSSTIRTCGTRTRAIRTHPNRAGANRPGPTWHDRLDERAPTRAGAGGRRRHGCRWRSDTLDERSERRRERPAGAARANPDRPQDVRLGRADVRRRDRQRHARFVLRRRAPGPGRARARHRRAGGGQARAMVAEGADLLDVGGESTRPGHAEGRPGRGVARTCR